MLFTHQVPFSVNGEVVLFFIGLCVIWKQRYIFSKVNYILHFWEKKKTQKTWVFKICAAITQSLSLWPSTDMCYTLWMNPCLLTVATQAALLLVTGGGSLASISQQQSAQHDSVSMQLNTVEEQLSLLLASDWFTVMISVAVALWRTQRQELMRLKPQMFSEKLFIICIASCVSNTNRRSLGTVVVWNVSSSHSSV